ncbi:FapA family protein [Spirochaeta lutea]|nr:FapA family protein [Spirochaeta lutea]
MKNRLEEDRGQRYVNVSGESLADALQQASIELSLPVKAIEYEILDGGSKGFMGVGKKPTLILAYPGAKAAAEAEAADFEDFTFDKQQQESRDGQFFLRRDETGVLLKVIPPQNGGIKVNEKHVLEAILERHHGDFDRSLVSKICKRAEGDFIKIAEIDRDPTNDALLNFELAEMEMKAFITIRQPGPGGVDPDAERITGFLRANNIVFGYLDEAIQSLVDNPVYNQQILVAEGQSPVNGEDGKIIYNFEKETDKIRLREIDGKVDYKELNKINNVVEGQVLAKVIAPKRGVPGHTVTGKLLPARDGKAVTLEVGNNVRLSDDKTQAIASANGQVLLLSGKISVEPIYVVNGNVDLKSGNILFLGSVVVKGNVEDGFAVKAAGNIEILGSVGKCELDAEGDIVVRQGINGKSAGLVRSGGSIWSKFLENSEVESGGYVVVSDGIINSQITSDKKVICRGKRASIVGGHIRATEEITAKTLGSVAGMETVLEVGYDPKSKAHLEELQERRSEAEKALEEVRLNLATLEKTLKLKKELPKDKQRFYDNLQEQVGDLEQEIMEVSEEIQTTERHLAQLKSSGRVSASARVFPGVKVIIKEAPLEVRNEFRAVTFVAESGMVKVTKYVESDDQVELNAITGGE